MNTATRPRSVYWRRRAVVAAAGATGMIMLIHSCASSGPPHLQITAKEAPSVPVLHTFTPTPTPTPSASPSAAPDVVAATSRPPAPATPAAATPVVTAPAKGGKHQAVVAAAAPSPSGAPAVAPAEAPAAVPAAAAIPGCKKSDLAVELRTDSADYAGRAKPKFYIGVSNIGPNPCQVDLGSVALSFTVRSGPDRIWSSRDCQGKGTHDVRTLTPGQKLWGRSIWSKVRSAKGCPADEADARPGTYTLEGSAAGVKAQKRIVFRIR